MSVDHDIQWKQTDMVEVSLSEPDDFLKVRETLTRICLLYTSPSPRDRG